MVEREAPVRRREHGGAERTPEAHRSQPNPATTVHHQHLTGSESAALDHTAVGGTHPASDQCSVAVRDRVRYDDGVDISEWHHGELGECTPAREPRLFLTSTHLVLAQSTRLTLAAPAHERSNHALTHEYSANFSADCNDPTDELVRRSVEKGWGLYQLTPAQARLEDVFANLTRREEQS